MTRTSRGFISSRGPLSNDLVRQFSTYMSESAREGNLFSKNSHRHQLVRESSSKQMSGSGTRTSFHMSQKYIGHVSLQHSAYGTLLFTLSVFIIVIRRPPDHHTAGIDCSCGSDLSKPFGCLQAIFAAVVVLPFKVFLLALFFPCSLLESWSLPFHYCSLSSALLPPSMAQVVQGPWAWGHLLFTLSSEIPLIQNCP